jgi:hypothetical protein
MKLGNVDTYSDIVTIANAIGGLRAVFYKDNIALNGNMTIAVILADGKIGFNTTLSGLSSPPPTFATDFPNAIATDNGLTVS